MTEALEQSVAAWIRFAGFVLVIAVLYLAQAVLVPVALAVLITFVLTPPVTFLQRRIGRGLAVLVTVVLVFTVLGLAGLGLATQISKLAGELPRYRANIRQKIDDVRGAARGGSMQQVQETVNEIQKEAAGADTPRGNAREPVIVQSQQVSSLTDFPSWIGPAVGPLATAGFVLTLVFFMLLEREELRGRVIGLIGHGHLAVTTKAFDEAAKRVSRQLLMQTLVNAIYGVAIGVGLWALGTPYPLLWAALGAALRFVPYLGPIAAAAGPILVSLAALSGWTRPLEVMALFVAVELFTNLVLETVLYAGAAGVSQVALLIAVAAWTWLWGSMGLLLATPLTVCLVVLGKHVPGLDFLSTLMADSPVLAPDVSYYQRLLAGDQSEAAEIVQRHLATQPAATVYDALMLPALNYAERDRLEGRLSDAEEQTVIEETSELLNDVHDLTQALRPSSEAAGVDNRGADGQPMVSAAAPVAVIGYAANGQADATALKMLAQLAGDEAIHLHVASARLLTAEIVDLVQTRQANLVCIADLPPSPPSKTRYVVRKLRAALPDVRILVGRWAPADLADDDPSALIEAGANHVATTLIETRDHLRTLALHERQRSASVSSDVAASPESPSALVSGAKPDHLGKAGAQHAHS